MKQYIMLSIAACFFICTGSIKAHHTAGAWLSITKTTTTNEYLLKLFVLRDCTSDEDTMSQSVGYLSVSQSLGGVAFMTKDSSYLITSNSCIPFGGFTVVWV